jgi:hypothetical protein
MSHIFRRLLGRPHSRAMTTERDAYSFPTFSVKRSRMRRESWSRTAR